MKVHLAKRFSGNKVSLRRTECGRDLHGISQVIMIVKTKLFRERYEVSKDSVCLRCAGKAKEQNRI